MPVAIPTYPQKRRSQFTRYALTAARQPTRLAKPPVEICFANAIMTINVSTLGSGQDSIDTSTWARIKLWVDPFGEPDRQIVLVIG
jgi:hypothetical protein